MTSNVKEILQSYCSENGIALSDGKADAFVRLTELLLEYNSHTNLTAIKEPSEVAVKHYADSLSSLSTASANEVKELFPHGARVVDVGCGAGFPGLPIALVREDIRMTFIDSTDKKLRFTRGAAEELAIDCECVTGRAEELAGESSRREGYDVAVSRAVAALPVLCELCLPFVKKNGLFIAYKASGAEEELKAAKSAIPLLGGKYLETRLVALPECGEERLSHSLIIIKKISSTPPKYPRRYAQILKSPL